MSKVCDGWKLLLFEMENIRVPGFEDAGSGKPVEVIRSFVAKLVSSNEVLEAGTMSSDGVPFVKPSQLCKKRVGKSAWDVACQEMRDYLTVRAVMES